MIVECIKSDSEDSNAGWLERGRRYLVVAINVCNCQVKYRLITDEFAAPALHEARYFEIVSSRISSNWAAQFDESTNCMDLEPAAWAHSRFWVEYFDGHAEAKATFDAEVSRMYVEEGYPAGRF
jgi:hypothetical protein